MKLIIVQIALFFTLSLFTHTVTAGGRPSTLVLVHGAHLTSGIWGPVQSHLHSKGFNTVAFDVPGRAEDGVTATQATLDSAVRKLCNVIGIQASPVILVGHSQGGAIISHALGQCPKHIKGLIYIAAVVPLPGTSAFEDLSKEDGVWFSKCAILDSNKKVWTLLPNAPLYEAFMADVPQRESEKYKSIFVDEPSLIGDGIIKYDQILFNKIPKIFIETTQDRIITIATQQRIQSREIFAKTYSLTSSHSPFFSVPKLLANVLNDSARVIEKLKFKTTRR